jgi:hypothetical protein
MHLKKLSSWFIKEMSAVKITVIYDVRPHTLVGSYQRFGATHCLNFYSYTLKMKAESFFDMSVTNGQCTRLHITEDSNLQSR